MSRQGVLLKALGNRFGTWSQKDVLQMHCIHFIQKAGKGLIQRGTCLSRTSENLHDHALTELHYNIDRTLFIFVPKMDTAAPAGAFMQESR